MAQRSSTFKNKSRDSGSSPERSALVKALVELLTTPVDVETDKGLKGKVTVGQEKKPDLSKVKAELPTTLTDEKDLIPLLIALEELEDLRGIKPTQPMNMSPDNSMSILHPYSSAAGHDKMIHQFNQVVKEPWVKDYFRK